MNKKTIRLQISEMQRYAVFGALFGFLFPIIGTLLRTAISQQPLNISSMINTQRTDPLLWLVDSAPLFLGLLAGYAGHKQDMLLKSNKELNEREMEFKKYQLDLEARVDMRTSEIERRSKLLKAVADVGRSITSYRNLSELLQQTTQLIRENFGYYHIGIFLLDERK